MDVDMFLKVVSWWARHMAEDRHISVEQASKIILGAVGETLLSLDEEDFLTGRAAEAFKRNAAERNKNQ